LSESHWKTFWYSIEIQSESFLPTSDEIATLFLFGRYCSSYRPQTGSSPTAAAVGQLFRWLCPLDDKHCFVVDEIYIATPPANIVLADRMF